MKLPLMWAALSFATVGLAQNRPVTTKLDADSHQHRRGQRVQFVDPESAGLPHRFYRWVQEANAPVP